MDKVTVGIIGASGYTGVELARLLAAHPGARLELATASGERVGQRLSDLFPSLRKVCDIVLEEVDAATIAARCQVAFIALGHGKALEIVPDLLARGVKVIDLGADFRLRDAAVYQEWYKLPHTAAAALAEAVYGLPEWQREKIKSARLVANPGCYPTSAILALAPYMAHGAIVPETIIVDSGSGVSGAGRSSFGVASYFPEVSGDYKAYGVASHRHTPEIEQGLQDAANCGGHGERTAKVTFTPHLLPIPRGILSTCYATPTKEFHGCNLHDFRQFLVKHYEEEPFVRILDAGQTPQIKHVAGSNFCDIGVVLDERTNRLIVIAAEDNLLKGASGQAVQNMNLMLGLDETAGLLGASLYP